MLFNKKKRAAKIAGTVKSFRLFLCSQRYKDAKRLIYSPSLQSKMKSDTYILQSYKSAQDGLKSARLDYVTKTGCKYSTLFNNVLQCNKVPGCKFAIQPKNGIGLRSPERLRVQHARTIWG